MMLYWLLIPVLIAAGERPPVYVGMHGQLKGVILPGPELEVKPLDDPHAPFVLRIDDVHRHGDAFRYDFVYYGLEPRTYDLTNYLRPKGGEQTAKLDPLEVEVKSILPAGLIHPHTLEVAKTGWFAYYKWSLLIGGVVWFTGLLCIVFWRRWRRISKYGQTSSIDVSDRLRPLVVRAMAGILTNDERAELERLLIGFWRHKLDLDHDTPTEALAKLRQHPDAGVLLNQLDEWLHKPGSHATVDLGKLLWPYRFDSIVGNDRPLELQESL